MVWEIDLDLHKEFVDTIEWNRLGRGGKHDFSDKAYEVQLECLKEEVEELSEAIKAGDKVEVLDAMCDIVFVAVYLLCILKNSPESPSEDILEILSMKCYIEYDDIKSPVERLQGLVEYKMSSALFYSLVSDILLLSVFMPIDFKGAYREVVRSNFTKFPKMTQQQIENELEYFEEYSAYKDITALNFGDRVVFRADGGEGKIMKPRCYSEAKLEGFIYG